MKNILKLNNSAAKKFFLKQESYCRTDLPIYFSFQPLLNAVSTKIGNKPLQEFYGSYHDKKKGKDRPTLPCNCEDVNYTLLNNKDGKYAWRPLQLIHPAIYVDLVNRITTSDNWKFLVKRFRDFRTNEQLICLSLPFESYTEKSDKSVQVKQWWVEVEQQSIELALDYEFILHADISNCYGSFYTHSIAWALHGKEQAKEKRADRNLLGNIIDECVRNMTYGQTNGIPQGSALMDFIAEMILGFADLQLIERIKKAKIKDWKILRFRDDYRIFTNNPQDTDQILKFLTEVLIGLGMKLNASKTIASSSVARDSLKPEKLYWINQKQSSKRLQEELFIIHSLSEKYPNSGVLEKALMAFFDRITKMKKFRKQILPLISIAVDIMLKNPRAYPILAAILSKLISLELDKEVRKRAMTKIINRFNKIPNTGYLEIWLQRMTLKHDGTINFEETLCKKVMSKNTVVWNSTWLEDKFKTLIDAHSIIDDRKMAALDLVIKRSEVALFRSVYSES